MQYFKKYLAALMAFAMVLACLPAVALPAKAATTHQTKIWDLESGADTLNVNRTSDSRNDSWTTMAADKGVSGSNAMKYEALEEDTVTETKSGISRSITQTLSGLQWASYGGSNATVQATDDIFWMWINAEFSTIQRFTFQLQGNDIKKASTIYTIVNQNGQPAMQEIVYSADPQNPSDAVSGIDLVNGNAYTNAGSAAQIRLTDPDWSGWIGIPLNTLATVPAVGTALTKFNLMLNQYSSEDAIADQNVGDAVYLDEFWLTSAGTMPNLPNEALLYNGDAAPSVTVDFALNARYQDGMIFQQKENWMVHGVGTAGKTVTVKLLDGSNAVQTQTATIGDDGTWSVSMSAVNGSYTYYKVTATCGSTTKTVSNVAFGEVWVTGGQSNMYYKISHTNETDMFGSQADVTALQNYLNNNPKAAAAIRMYYYGSTPTPTDNELSDVLGAWHTAESWDSVYSTSAVAMHYAKKLQAELDVPVGVVVAARGGTSIGTWVDADVAQNYSEFTNLMNALGYPTTDNTSYRAYGYYNAHVAPWQGYNVAGLLWYQGENDRFNPLMQELGFEVMVESFSRTFTADYSSTGLMDVIAIQVAPFFGYLNNRPDPKMLTNSALNAAMRAGAAKVQAKGGNAVLIPIYDLPTVADDHHPLNKEDVAARILKVAQETYYDNTSGNEIYSGPVPVSHKTENGVVTITFDQAIQFIPLTKANNERLLLKEDFKDALPAESELYATTLNGFSIWNGQEFIGADAKIVGSNQVEVTIPSGITQIAGVAYAYGVEVLSANMYDADGLPALPFLIENEDFTHSIQLWSADEVEATVIVEENKYTGTPPRNTSKVSIADGVGFGGSQGLKYELVDTGNDRTNTWNGTTMDTYGFRTDLTITADDDILWFWASANYSTIQRLQFAVNSQTIVNSSDSYIYTLGCGNDGNPALIKIPHGGTDPVDGISLLRHSSTQAQIQMEPGWSGWIGIPVNMFDKYAAVKGGTISSISVILLQKTAEDPNLTNQKVGDNVVLDEFWLTSAGCYPNLSNLVSLQANVWSVEDADLTDGKELGLAGTSTSRDTMSTVVAADKGVGGSKALAYVFETATQSNSNNVSLSDDLLGDYGYTATPIQDPTNVLWFWVDSDLADDRLLHLQLNGSANYLGPNFIYTIVEENGIPTRKTVNYDAQALMSGDGLALVASGGNGGAAESNYARIRLDAGWSGWIGVPVENFSGTGGNTAIPTGNISNITFRLFGTKNTAVLNQAVYFDEFWLTDADMLPGLSNELLLYKEAEEVPSEPTTHQTLLQNFNSLTAGANVGTMQGTTANNYGPASATISAANGINGSQSMAYTIKDINYNQNQNVQLDDELAAHTVQAATDILWFWVDSDLRNERLLHVQINGTSLKKESIFTIVNDNGTPQIVSVNYVDNRATVDTLAPVNATWNGGNSYARVKIPTGWFGWIGIPMSSVDISSGTIEKIQLRLYGERNQAPVAVDDVFYMDEFWLISAGLMPNLTNAELLYKGEPDLAFSAASLEVNEGISINFKVAKDVFAANGYSLDSAAATFVFNKGAEDERSFTVTNPTMSKDGLHYVFQLIDIRPDWMGDIVTATLTATMGGKEFTSEPLEYSVATYCYNQLAEQTEKTELSTLLVDILNYGAATQTHTGYKTNALVNAKLTAAQAAWGTATAPAMNAAPKFGTEVTDPTARFKSAALYLRETVRILLSFVTDSIENVTVTATIGGTTHELTAFVDAGNGKYYVFFDGLKAYQMREGVVFTVLQNGTAISNSLTYSAEAYAAEVTKTAGTLTDMLKAMMNYGDALIAYVN